MIIISKTSDQTRQARAYGIPPEFRGGVHSLSVHTMYYECMNAAVHISIALHTMYVR